MLNENFSFTDFILSNYLFHNDRCDISKNTRELILINNYHRIQVVSSFPPHNVVLPEHVARNRFSAYLQNLKHIERRCCHYSKLNFFQPRVPKMKYVFIYFLRSWIIETSHQQFTRTSLYLFLYVVADWSAYFVQFSP